MFIQNNFYNNVFFLSEKCHKLVIKFSIIISFKTYPAKILMKKLFNLDFMLFLNLCNFYGYQGKIDQTIACLEKYLKWAEKIKKLIYEILSVV